jgi:hypothetical protein
MEVRMCEGIVDELDGIYFRDKRLAARSKVLLNALAQNPEASINAACDRWSDTQAAYRFFGNKSVSPEEILQPHCEATIRRAHEHSVVLLVQDTTELDYTDHPQRDAKFLADCNHRGIYMHAQLAVTPQKLSLGVIAIDFHERELESLGKSKERKTWPIEEKESFRWLKGYRRACELGAACPTTQIVMVADRECDIYDIFVDAQEGSHPRVDYVVRAQEDRSTFERDPSQGKMGYRKVRDEVAESTVLLERTIALVETPKRKAREATVEIRAITVTVKPPHARARLPSVTYNVVFVKEIGGPNDGTDVEWLLITTLPIDTVSEIQIVVDYYLARWAVEIFFRILKAGCRVEDIMLETTHRLKNCLAMYCIIGWRVQYLTYLNRTSPTLSCTAVFTSSEWKSVWKIVTKTEIPKTPPRLSDFMALLSQLGGYNNRPSERPFGPLPVWVGIRRMMDFAIAWETFCPDA